MYLPSEPDTGAQTDDNRGRPSGLSNTVDSAVGCVPSAEPEQFLDVSEALRDGRASCIRCARAENVVAECKTGEEIAAEPQVWATTLYNCRRGYSRIYSDGAKGLAELECVN